MTALFTTFTMEVLLRNQEAVSTARQAVRTFAGRVFGDARNRELILQNRMTYLRLLAPNAIAEDRNVLDQIAREDTFIYVDLETNVLRLRHVTDNSTVHLMLTVMGRLLEPFTDQPFFLEQQNSNEALPTRTFFALSLAEVEMRNLSAQIDDAVSRLPQGETETQREEITQWLRDRFGVKAPDSHLTTDIDGGGQPRG